MDELQDDRFLEEMLPYIAELDRTLQAGGQSSGRPTTARRRVSQQEVTDWVGETIANHAPWPSSTGTWKGKLREDGFDEPCCLPEAYEEERHEATNSRLSRSRTPQ